MCNREIGLKAMHWYVYRLTFINALCRQSKGDVDISVNVGGKR
jgi:hypothetical protein